MIWLDSATLDEERIAADPTAAEEVGEAARGVCADVGLRQCRIVVYNAELAAMLANGLAATGYSSTRAFVMAPEGGQIRWQPGIRTVEALSIDEYLAVNERYLIVEEGHPRSIALQLAEAARVFGAGVGWERLGARAGDDLASCCELYLDANVVKPENLFTFYALRRQGYASSVFNEVLRRGLSNKPALIFVVVVEGNAEALPLYEKFGFRRVGTIHFFERQVG